MNFEEASFKYCREHEEINGNQFFHPNFLDADALEQQNPDQDLFLFASPKRPFSDAIVTELWVQPN